MRCTCLFALCLLSACAPVRGDDDDSSGGGGGGGSDVETVWEELQPGACAVLPADTAPLATGAGIATNGLWYDIGCVWTGGNASEVRMELEWFDEANGGDFAVTSFTARSAGGDFISFDGDTGSVHLLEGTWGVLNGWWEGDLAGVDAAGQPYAIEAVVWRDASVESVMGR